MPARRRFLGSESDENFSVLIDGDSVVNSENSNKLIESPFSGDEKKKYATTGANTFLGSGYSVAGFSVPTGLTKLSSSIGTFLQQQVNQVANATSADQLFFENNQTVKRNNPSNLNNNTAFDQNDHHDDDYDDCDRNSASEIVTMASRDRTDEFSKAIQSMQGRNIARAVNIRDPRKATQLQSYSEFMMIAKHIGKNIASTYSKLEKLTLRKLIGGELSAIDLTFNTAHFDRIQFN